MHAEAGARQPRSLTARECSQSLVVDGMHQSVGMTMHELPVRLHAPEDPPSRAMTNPLREIPIVPCCRSMTTSTPSRRTCRSRRLRPSPRRRERTPQSIQRPGRVVESSHRVATVRRHERVVVRILDPGGISLDIARKRACAAQ